MAAYEFALTLGGAERVPSRWIPAAVVTIWAMLKAVILNTAWTFVVVLSARRLTHRLDGAPTIGSSS
jgi:hypothetical protein